jgi:PleD family two-component response regulator
LLKTRVSGIRKKDLGFIRARKVEKGAIMRILVADDDLTYCRMLEALLRKWGYEPVVTHDGEQAGKILQAPQAPQLAILDWMMPGKDGVDVCRQVRQASLSKPTYIILLTSKERKEDIVSGLDAGADDYMTKPFEKEELRARVQVGERILKLQTELARRVKELQEALAQIKTLEGIVPICMYCKKIRNDQNYWQQVEIYISEHSKAEFTHGLCPECMEKYYKRPLEGKR